MFKWIKNLMPGDHPLKREDELEAKHRRTIRLIARYENLTAEIQEIIDHDNFEKYLKYEGKRGVTK